jgi:hypothetical protein
VRWSWRLEPADRFQAAFFLFPVTFCCILLHPVALMQEPMLAGGRGRFFRFP